LALDKAKVLAVAQKQLARNNIDKALKELSRIIRDDPKDLRVRQKIAELLARQGKISEAMREFSVVAEAYERGGFYPKSAAIYKQMLRFEPDQMRWHLSLGEIYQQLALLSDAMDHFNIVAQHFEQEGSVKERVDIYEKLLKLNPDSLEYGEKLADLYTQEADTMAAFEVWRKLAESLEARGDSEGLTRVYERMSEAKPDDLTLVRALADLYLDRGDPRRALAKLQICFKADPQDTETLNLLADAFVDLGQNEKAVAVLKELAQIYDSLGYEEYRNQVYDRISEIDPQAGGSFDADASLQIPGGDEVVDGLDLSEPIEVSEAAQRVIAEAEVYLQYGLSDKAQAALERATAQFPDAWTAHRTLVRLYAASGDLAAAQDRLNRMYELAMDRHDYRAAKACLERAAALAPDDDAATARVKAFAEAMGEYATADETGDEAAAMAAAVELGSSIAESVADEPTQAGRLDVGTSDDEFDFDDDEMQRLAAELSRELGGSKPSAAAVPTPKPDEEDEKDEDGFDFDLGDDLLENDDDDFNFSTAASPGTDATFREPAAAREPVAAQQSAPSNGEVDLTDLFADLEADDETLNDLVRSPLEVGLSYYQAGKYDDAAIEFQRAIDEDNQASEALEYLGNARRRTHDFRGAVDAFKQLLGRSTSDAGEVLRIMFELGVTYEAAGNSRGAYKIFKKITDRDQGFRDGEVAERVTYLANQLGLN
jgi:tetratricopeptide (TPR) repeat protein